MWISSTAPRMRAVDWSGLSKDAAEARAQTIKYMEKNSEGDCTKEKWRPPMWNMQETCGFWRERGKVLIFVFRTAAGKEIGL